ncbi:hypothetical protein F383_20113 [Gossypium arboreum]|uniref:Uncharacterized protein n=1 Tax=Gossypium arboreum TaxID=29729 RepID=A0A0B0NQH7_GOSAR|nr:hypothetical protein F383_20113 [Gossypium arboreum]
MPHDKVTRPCVWLCGVY